MDVARLAQLLLTRKERGNVKSILVHCFLAVLDYPSSVQFHEARMMRGTPDFLDKHMSAPTQPTASIQQQQQQPAPAMPAPPMVSRSCNASLFTPPNLGSSRPSLPAS